MKIKQETLQNIRMGIAEGKINPAGLKQEVLEALARSLIAQGQERASVSDEVLSVQLERLKDRRQRKEARRSLPGLIKMRILGISLLDNESD